MVPGLLGGVRAREGLLAARQGCCVTEQGTSTCQVLRPPATRAGPAGAAAGCSGAYAQVQLMTRNFNKWGGKLYLEANRDRACRK